MEGNEGITRKRRSENDVKGEEATEGKMGEKQQRRAGKEQAPLPVVHIHTHSHCLTHSPICFCSPWASQRAAVVAPAQLAG